MRSAAIKSGGSRPAIVADSAFARSAVIATDIP
jgi:hypothetical protein